MNGNMLATLLPLVLLLVIMYFLLIRPQKKREKQVNEMRSNVRVGDEIITIGGICGKVVKTKDESLVIQVGADKVKFEIMRWSVSKVVENAKPTKKVSVSSSAKEEEEESPKKRWTSFPVQMDLWLRNLQAANGIVLVGHRLDLLNR